MGAQPTDCAKEFSDTDDTVLSSLVLPVLVCYLLPQPAGYSSMVWKQEHDIATVLGERNATQTRRDILFSRLHLRCFNMASDKLAID